MRSPLPLRPTRHIPAAPAFDALAFFEAAARLESFTGAAAELGVTSSAVAYRVKSLERYLGVRLFERYARGVRLNAQGKAYLEDIQRILAEFHSVNERLCQDSWKPVLKLITVEVFAEKWRMPRFRDFKAVYPDLAIEFETDRGAFDPEHRDFDIWIAFTDKGDNRYHCETLFEETLVPVCSPSLLEARGRPGNRASCATGRCCTTLSGRPTGRAGSRSRTRRRPTCPGDTVSVSMA